MLKGLIAVQVEGEWTILKENQTLNVPIGKWHRFVGLSKKAIVVEWYENKFGTIMPQDDDIERLWEGHVLDDKEIAEIQALF